MVNNFSPETWNVGKPYSELMIMKELLQASYYEELAECGTDDVNSEMMATEEQIINARIRALRRYAVKLEKIMISTKFRISDKKGDFKKLRERLQNVRKRMHAVYNNHFDQTSKKKRTNINEEYFDVILQEMKNIREELTQCLYENELIFQLVEEEDPDQWAKDFAELG